ncbi:glycosyltransferase [Salidesulfovibrio onnuriiensis]|uniref:glycosyltransferase n=1 Tax=Salidesulfovibrio onnuriiensis TaxID=2583823 RepID=UPI0011C9086B|nr:glycosyltransferase [Salidesulfovibrio onnuriiensis]
MTGIPNLPFAGSDLFPPLKRHLPAWALGSESVSHQMGMLQGLDILAAEYPQCAAAGQALAHWAWSNDPLSVNLLERQLSRQGERPYLTPQCFHLAMALAKRLTPLQDQEMELTWQALTEERDIKLIRRFLLVKLRDPATCLSWLARVWRELLLLGTPDLPMAALEAVPWPEELLPLRARLEAEWAVHYHSPEEALLKILKLDTALWGAWKLYFSGEMLLRAGQKREGLETLVLLWQAMPWHVNLTLKLHDLIQPPETGTEEETAAVAVLAYSWNKGDLLAQTLESLEQSAIGQAKIFTLDNGSTDSTPEVLKRFGERFGPDRFTSVTLPVNVGAPPARNWLLSLPEVQACKWAAFLDDDIILPEDWLPRLLGAARAQPNAGAIGCRITAAVPPYGLQSGDYNVFPQLPLPPADNELPNRVLAFDNCSGGLDTGLFSYSRPCLSVSGCCHMVSLESIRKTGPFDVRFNPSQFDDIDRDLRSCLEGMPAFYCGGLAIRHVQHSSLAKAQTVRQMGQVMGNKLKLDTKYSDEDLQRIIDWNNQRLWADFEHRRRLVLDRFPPGI